jgi:hypothetical protein
MIVPSRCDRDIAESPAGIELTEQEWCSEPLRQNRALTASLRLPHLHCTFQPVGFSHDVSRQDSFRAIDEEERSLSCGFGRLSPEPPDDMWQLMYPLSSFLAVFIIKSFREAVNYHAVRPFDLTIGPWVCNRDIFDLDARIFKELPELVSREV